MGEKPVEKRVDEAWKAQVEAEKQASSDTPVADPPLPQPTFAYHISVLVSQALVALGSAPDPVSGKVQFRPNLARHLIDTLAMLEEKTRGNLSPEESQQLQNALYQLRLAFVERGKTPPPSGSEKSPRIVTP